MHVFYSKEVVSKVLNDYHGDSFKDYFEIICTEECNNCQNMHFCKRFVEKKVLYSSGKMMALTE